MRLKWKIYMQNRPKIALVGAKDFDMSAIKKRVEALSQHPEVFVYPYDNTEFSETDAAAIADANQIYFFYDPSPGKQESRKPIPAVLGQINQAKASRPKKPISCVVACVPDAITEDHKQLTKAGVSRITPFGFEALSEPFSAKDLAPLVVKMGAALSETVVKMSADLYGSVKGAQPAPSQPVLSQHASSQSAAPGQVASAPSLDTVISSLRSEDALFRDALTHLNESLKRASAAVSEEAKNLNSIQTKAAEVVQAFQTNDRGKLVVAIDQMATTTSQVLDGKPSLSNMILGSILCFLGVALLAASIPLYLLLPPVAFVGTVLATNIVVAGAAAAIGLPMAIGFGIFAIKNKEMGVVHDSKQFIKAVKP